MPTYSANLGFLFTELDLPDAIRAARKAGFAAVECHWPYDTPTDQVNAALSETGLRMLHGITVLIEPLNRHDAPGYFLNTSQQAKGIIDEVASDGLKLMFDCYHIQIQEGDLTRRLQALRPIIGHIQFASVPDRGKPNHGEVDYRWLFQWFDAQGFTQPLGAEYKETETGDNRFDWLQLHAQ